MMDGGWLNEYIDEYEEWKMFGWIYVYACI